MNSHLIPNPEKSNYKILLKLEKKTDFWLFWDNCAHFLAKMKFLKKLVSVSFFLDFTIKK